MPRGRPRRHRPTPPSGRVRTTRRFLLLLASACETGAARGERERRKAADAKRKADHLKFVRDLHQGRFAHEYYSGVGVGMDLEQVTAELGDSGREVSVRTDGKTTTQVMEWGDATGTISVTFVDGKVSAKSKPAR